MPTKPNTNPPGASTSAPPVSPSSPPASSGIVKSEKSGTVLMPAMMPPVAIIPANSPASISPIESTMQVAAVSEARSAVPTQVSALPMMDCPVCAVSTPVAKYCSDCGALMVVKKFCSDCGTSLKGTAKFCDSCGARTD